MDVKVRAMVDLQDREATVAAIREALQRFETDAPPPAVAVDLLRQLHEQLADSGPFEFGLRWRRAVEISGRELGRLESDVLSVRSALAALEVFFANGSGWRWWWLSASIEQKVLTGILAPFLLLCLLLWWLLFWPLIALQRRRSVLGDPRSAAVSPELRDRLLFATTCRSSRGGSDRRRLIVATDRGIVIGKPEHTRVRIECEIPYPQVRKQRTGDRNSLLAIRAPDNSEDYIVGFVSTMEAIVQQHTKSEREGKAAPPNHPGDQR
jgi:hypothetical protein